MNSSSEMREISLIIVTHRDIFQWVSQMKGLREQYQERSALASLSPDDMKILNIEDDDKIKIRNALGAVVVQAKLDSSCPRGFAFMPVGHYSSRLVEYDPNKARLPGFKRIEVSVEATEEEITPITELQ